MLAEFQLWALSATIVVALGALCAPLPMLSEFQLRLQSTFVLVALLVVCVMLPARV